MAKTKTKTKTTARATATAKAKAEQEELKDLVARRIREVTGQPARIRNLVYQVFTSTFLGQRIEVGPRGRPLVSVRALKAEMVLFGKTSSERGTTFALLEVDRPVARIPAAWAERPYRYPIRPASLRLATVSDGQLTLTLVGGGQVVLRGIQLRLSGLTIPATAAGSAPKISGAVSLKVKRLELPDLNLDGLELEGKLVQGNLEIARLRAGLPGGELLLAGSVGLGGAAGPGPVELSGTVKARPFGEEGALLEGKVKLVGQRADRLTLSGELTPPAGRVKLPRRGGTKGAPPLALKMRLGQRRLSGSWSRWQLR